MKKLIASTMLAVGVAFASHAQGTLAFQNFSNAGGGLVDVDTLGTHYTGAVTVELFWGPVGDTQAQLLSLNNGVVFATTISTSTPGKFFDGTTVNTTLPAGTGTADSTMNAELVIAAWTGGAANYAAALAAGNNKVGITTAFANPTGGGGTPAATAAGMINWVAANSVVMTPVPEPTTLALGGLGAAALLLFRRKQK